MSVSWMGCSCVREECRFVGCVDFGMSSCLRRRMQNFSTRCELGCFVFISREGGDNSR